MRKQRYWRIAPWLHYNGVAVLSLRSIRQRVAVRFFVYQPDNVQSSKKSQKWTKFKFSVVRCLETFGR
nr:MAG TPA: hypothetical protein [Caudoviricetes sp.]